MLIAVRVSETEYKQIGYGKGYCNAQYLFFCYRKMKPNSFQQRIDRKFGQMGFGQMDERGLLKRLRNGDEKAFEKIMDMYSAYGMQQKMQYCILSSLKGRLMGVICCRWVSWKLAI